MADNITPAERSAVMAAVRSTRNRSTELRLVTLLRAWGITGWRRGSLLPGRPDFVFSACRIAVFVDGCFWHGCPAHGRLPSSHRPYWKTKIARNRRRDRQNARILRQRGWRVLRVWEHELRPAAEGPLRRRLRRHLERAANGCQERGSRRRADL